jgi:hypothetical protein
MIQSLQFRQASMYAIYGKNSKIWLLTLCLGMHWALKAARGAAIHMLYADSVV